MWKIAIIPVLSILVLWAWQLLNWVWIKPRKLEKLLRKQGMKGNSYRFLFGDSKETSDLYEKAYSKPIGINDDIVARVMPNIHHTVQKYGNYSFSWSGPRPRIFILETNVAREVFNNYRKYVKTFKISNRAVQLLATGIANLEGDEWSKSRSRLNPAFNMDKLKPMVPSIYVCCDDTLNEWNKIVSKDGGSCVLDVFPHLEIFTGAVLAQLLFSSTYTEEIKQTFLQLAELAILARVPSSTFTIPGEKYLPTKMNRRVNEIDKYVRSSVISLVNKRLQRSGGEPPSGKCDLLDLFMHEYYDGKTKSASDRRRINDYINGECKIFFFAGFETTSNLLSWAFILLSIHQDWQTRARQEVFQVLGDKKEITSNDLAKLKIVTMIVNEILRLFPPFMELSRIVDEETKIKDLTIPKDSLVTFPILMYHRSTEIWGKDALEFNPERFADGVLKASNGEAAFMPFGWGPRICIGMNFAILEAKTFLAMLLRQFSFELSPTYTHAPVVAFTIQPQYGAPVVLQKL